MIEPDIEVSHGRDWESTTPATWHHNDTCDLAPDLALALTVAVTLALSYEEVRHDWEVVGRVG